MGFFIPTAAAGNGISLATFGRSGEIMGFFYPRIDFAQNVRECMPAVRLLAGEEGFLWCFHDVWDVSQSFEPRSNVLQTRLAHRQIDLTIELSDVLPPGEHGLLRRVILTRGPQVGPVQFVHYFRFVLGDSDTRNGVQAFPEYNLVLQHYRDIVVAVSATGPFAAQCGSWNEGAVSWTKQAMEAGHFGASGRAIGRVDFAIGFEPVDVQRWQTTIVIAGSSTQPQAISAARRLLEMPYEDAVTAANRRVASELDDAGDCPVPELTDAFSRAVISLHDLFDESQGTFIAAPEFDPGFELSGGYGYCWPRDAAACALAAQQIGRPDMARRFFEWAARTQLPTGHWYQRYWTDGWPGPSWCVRPDVIQLDQTCAIVHAAGRFARQLGADREAFVTSARPMVTAATEAMLGCIGDDGLHLPATDLWENSVGSFTYTQAALMAALREADEVFGLASARTGPAVRAALREQLIQRFWQPDRHRWLRRLTPEGEPDATLDSSAMGIIEPWEILDLAHAADQQLALATVEGISRDLRSEVKAGGAILRFQNESYMGGGPGCVNTLWLALCRLKLARFAADADLRRRLQAEAAEDIRIALANASPTGQLPELIPKISFAYWAAPHAWASSLLIEAVIALRSLVDRHTTAYASARAQVKRQAPLR